MKDGLLKIFVGAVVGTGIGLGVGGAHTATAPSLDEYKAQVLEEQPHLEESSRALMQAAVNKRTVRNLTVLAQDAGYGGGIGALAVGAGLLVMRRRRDPAPGV